MLLTAHAVPSSPILVTLVLEALRSSETSVLTTATRRNVQEDGILHSHRREDNAQFTCSCFIRPSVLPLTFGYLQTHTAAVLL
jgi:hypothetical protein